MRFELIEFMSIPFKLLTLCAGRKKGCTVAFWRYVYYAMFTDSKISK